MAGMMYQNLWESDPELFEIMKKEKSRQTCGLEMIASENFTSLSVLQCQSSCLHNKYSEGLPGSRYSYQILYVFIYIFNRVGQSTSSTKYLKYTVLKSISSTEYLEYKYLKYFLVLQVFKYFFKYFKIINMKLCRQYLLVTHNFIIYFYITCGT